MEINTILLIILIAICWIGFGTLITFMCDKYLAGEKIISPVVRLGLIIFWIFPVITYIHDGLPKEKEEK